MTKTAATVGTAKPITLEVCGCGKHGRFLLSDGRRSPEFSSKEEAFAILECCDLVGQFQRVKILISVPDSGDAIFAEINASTLDGKRSETSHLARVIRTWNIAKAFQPDLSIMDFHHVSEALYDYQAFAA